MSAVTLVGVDVEKIVKEIIARNNLNDISNIKYQPGSEAGDGYGSKTLAVEITNGDDIFRVFLKCALNIKSTDALPIDRIHRNEVYFYEEIRPAYLKFCESRGIKNALRNIPICYGTSSTIIALENLRERRFTMCDRTRCFNDEHIELVLKAFAQYHAVSYAFKEQEKQKYGKFVDNVFDSLTNIYEKGPFLTMVTNTISGFISKLDAVNDKDILEKCNGAFEKLISSLTSISKTLNEYSILTQGDCHCNNMMFLYELNDENKEKPSDIMLVDWQCPRPASPAFDLSLFFYSVASKEALENHCHYLKFYHDKLSKNIQLLGSDPKTLYPFEILKNEWKQHCKYGLAVAFMAIRAMLSSGDEIMDIEKLDFENAGNSKDPVIPNLKREYEYQSRMRILLEHMIRNNFLE